MSSRFSVAAARANAACLRIAGIPMTIQMPAGEEPFSFTGTRGMRSQDDNNPKGPAYERIWTRRGQFDGADRLPDKGDVVTIEGAEFVVHNVNPDKDPDSDGISIFLMRRNVAARP